MSSEKSPSVKRNTPKLARTLSNVGEAISEAISDVTSSVIRKVKSSPSNREGSPLPIMDKSLLENQQDEERQRELSSLGQRVIKNDFFKNLTSTPIQPNIIRPIPTYTPKILQFPTNTQPKEKEQIHLTAAANAEKKIANLTQKFNESITQYLDNVVKELDLSNIIKDFGRLFTFLPKLRGFNNIENESEKNRLALETYSLLFFIYEDLRLLAPVTEYNYVNPSSHFPTKTLEDSKNMETFIKFTQGDKLPIEIKEVLTNNNIGYNEDLLEIDDLLDTNYVGEDQEIKKTVNSTIISTYQLLWTLYKTKPNSKTWLKALYTQWQTIYNELGKVIEILPEFEEFTRKHGTIVSEIIDQDRPQSGWDTVLYKKSLVQIKKV